MRIFRFGWLDLVGMFFWASALSMLGVALAEFNRYLVWGALPLLAAAATATIVASVHRQFQSVRESLELTAAVQSFANGHRPPSPVSPLR